MVANCYALVCIFAYTQELPRRLLIFEVLELYLRSARAGMQTRGACAEAFQCVSSFCCRVVRCLLVWKWIDTIVVL